MTGDAVERVRECAKVALRNFDYVRHEDLADFEKAVAAALTAAVADARRAPPSDADIERAALAASEVDGSWLPLRRYRAMAVAILAALPPAPETQGGVNG